MAGVESCALSVIKKRKNISSVRRQRLYRLISISYILRIKFTSGRERNKFAKDKQVSNPFIIVGIYILRILLYKLLYKLSSGIVSCRFLAVNQYPITEQFRYFPGTVIL